MLLLLVFLNFGEKAYYSQYKVLYILAMDLIVILVTVPDCRGYFTLKGKKIYKGHIVFFLSTLQDIDVCEPATGTTKT